MIEHLWFLAGNIFKMELVGCQVRLKYTHLIALDTDAHRRLYANIQFYYVI